MTYGNQIPSAIDAIAASTPMTTAATTHNNLTSIAGLRSASAEVGFQKDDLRGDACTFVHSVQGHLSARQFTSAFAPHEWLIAPAQVVGLGGCDLAGVSPSYAGGHTLTERNDPATAWRECVFCFAVVVGLILFLADYEPAKIYDANGNGACLLQETAHQRCFQTVGSK